MPPNESSGPIWLPFAVLAGFIIVFPLFWCFVVYLISCLSGWGRLAATYAAPYPVSSRREHGGVCGRVGWANYKGVLSVTPTAEGFHLDVWPIFRPGHKPLFIPWADITDRENGRWLFKPVIKMKIGTPHITTITLMLTEEDLKP